MKTLFQEKEAVSQSKGWIQGNTKIGPVLESYLHGKHGVEIRIWSLIRDNTHSWIRISHGSNTFVINLNNKEQEIPEVQLEEYALKLDTKDFPCRAKTKVKSQKKRTCRLFSKNNSIENRTWTDGESLKFSLSENEISKKFIRLLRYGQHVHREDDGVVQFWRIKKNLQQYFLYCPQTSPNKCKKSVTIGGNKKRYQYSTDSSGTFVHLRTLQGHSGYNLIDPTLQDNVMVQSNFFQHIYHVGCAFNYHSIINSELILGERILSNRQTVFFLPVDPMDKNHNDPDTIDLSVPRHAQYMHKACERHQDAVYWIDINLAMTKGLNFYQTRSNAFILHETLTACCIPKVARMETGEVIFEKVYMSPRPPPKIFLKHDWKKRIAFRTCSTTRRTSCATI